MFFETSSEVQENCCLVSRGDLIVHGSSEIGDWPFS